MRHQQLVPSLHADRLNPHIDFASSPLRVQGELAPWPAGPAGVHRAGVSSFGAGGTNAHLILDSEPVSAQPTPARGQQLFVLSAKDRDALVRYARVWRSSPLPAGTPDPAPPAALRSGEGRVGEESRTRGSP